MNWNPRDHPRDDDGKFASGGGGGGGGAAAPRPSGPGRGRRGGLGHLGGTAIGYAASHNSGSRSSDHSGGGGGPSGGNPSASPRGMPTAVASDSVQLTKGGNATLERHANGGLSIGDGTRSSKPLTSGQSRQLLDTLGLSEDWPPGEEEALPGVGRVTRQRGGVQLDLDDGFSLSLTHRDARRLEVSADRLAKASRVDTGHGELDVFPDGKKIGFRHLDGDGRPVEAVFTRSAADKISSTIDRFIDDMDDPDLPVKDVYSKDISTNLGKVRVTLQGNWGSTNPGDRLTITPVDGGDWGITVDGSRQRAWSSALDDFLDEAAPGAECNLTERVSLTEATATLDRVQQTQAAKGRFKALLIKAGWGSSGYYSEALLKRDGPATWPVGTRMHLDHQTAQEAADRPEGSVRDWASEIVSTPAWDPVERGLVAEIQVFPQWRGLLNPEFAGRVGLSIRASGRVRHGEAEGRQGPIVESLEEGISVDWVTQAGAGGRVLELIESARLAEKNAEQKKAGRPGKAGTGEVGDGGERDGEEKSEGEEHEDDEGEGVAAKKKGKLPAFLKAKEAALGEAANVGHWMESRIHKAFTELADDAFGDGRLTRDERIGLSQAVGDGLKAFAARLETDHPHLYQRAVWDSPEEPDGDDGQELEEAPSSATTEPGSPPATTKEKEGVMPELTEAQARELQEARAAAEADRDAALSKATDAEIRLARFEAMEAARPIATSLLEGSTLPPAARARVLTATVTAGTVPLTAEHKLDEAALKTRVEEAAKAEATYLASLAEATGAGQVRGLGESTASTSAALDPATATALEETYKRRGMSPEAARLASVGRL